MECLICQSSESDKLFEGTIESKGWILNEKQYAYRRCTTCGFIQCDPLPPYADLLSFYQNNYAYEWFERNSFYKELQAKHRYIKIKPYLKGCTKLLDFGCGHGYFVKAVASKIPDTHGFDIGSDKIINSTHYKIVNKNSFSEYTENDFDVITAWHVIEHMRDLNETIDILKGKLKERGRVIIAVPNANSLGFRLFKQKWGWIQQPYVHISHFNDYNLRLLLKNHGFSVISSTTSDTWDQNLYDLLITLIFYRNKSRNVVRKYSRRFYGNVFFRLNQILRLIFTPVSYIYSVVLRRERLGSEILIVADRDVQENE